MIPMVIHTTSNTIEYYNDDRIKKQKTIRLQSVKSIKITSNTVGTTLNTMAPRMKLIARLPRSIILFKAPVSRLQTGK